jgi:hypothetical protein
MGEKGNTSLFFHYILSDPVEFRDINPSSLNMAQFAPNRNVLFLARLRKSGRLDTFSQENAMGGPTKVEHTMK